MIISHFTSIISSTGALRSSSSSSVCSSSPCGSPRVWMGSVGGEACVVSPGYHYHHYCQPNSLFKFLCFYLHFELVFFTNPPVTAESGECAFLKYFIFSSSSGTAVDWACSSFLKSHIRFKTKTWGDVFLV